MKRRSFFAVAAGAVAGLFGFRARGASRKRYYLQTFSEHHSAGSVSSSSRVSGWPEVHSLSDVVDRLDDEGYWDVGRDWPPFSFDSMGGPLRSLDDGEWRTTITCQDGALSSVSHWRVVTDPNAGLDGLHFYLRRA